MTKHTTKALNTLLIFAILCAFCITPAAAATATENVPIIFSKRICGVDWNRISCWYDETNPFGNIHLKMEIYVKFCRLVQPMHRVILTECHHLQLVQMLGRPQLHREAAMLIQLEVVDSVSITRSVR